MKIKIICVSDSDKHFAEAIKEYLKRMGNTIDMINLKPVRGSNSQEILERETKKIIEVIKDISSHKVLLAIDGKKFDTFGFVNLLQENNHICFIIGGPYGVDDLQLKPYINTKISLGAMTFPHGLAKTILLEQIYRAQMITTGKQYHY